MKLKNKIIISILYLISLIIFIVALIIMKNKIEHYIGYYLYLAFLSYICIILPFISLFIILILEAKRIYETNKFINVPIFLTIILAVGLVYVCTSYIEKYDYKEYKILFWLLIPLILFLSGILYVYLNYKASKEKMPKIVKK